MIIWQEPPRELIESRPEGVSESAAVHAWQTGFIEGYNEQEYRILTEDEIQQLYSNGYDKGESERKIHRALEVEEDREQEWRPGPWMPERAERVAHSIYYYEGAWRSLAMFLGCVYLVFRLILDTVRAIRG